MDKRNEADEQRMLREEEARQMHDYAVSTYDAGYAYDLEAVKSLVVLNLLGATASYTSSELSRHPSLLVMFAFGAVLAVYVMFTTSRFLFSAAQRNFLKARSLSSGYQWQDSPNNVGDSIVWCHVVLGHLSLLLFIFGIVWAVFLTWR